MCHLDGNLDPDFLAAVELHYYGHCINLTVIMVLFTYNIGIKNHQNTKHLLYLTA
jgi:hypothetical protein